MRSISVLLSSFAALLLSPTAFAVSCGDVLTTSVILTEDLSCSVSPALTVAGSGILIDLNGHTITAAGPDIVDGIVMSDVSSVMIAGPGRLNGFFRGVHAVRTDKLTIVKVEFSDEFDDPHGSLDKGVSLINSRFATIQDNRFKLRLTGRAIDVSQPNDVAGAGAGQHEILNNEFDTGMTGIHLCGADAGANRIEGNQFLRASPAVSANYQADGNTIRYNTFTFGAHWGVTIATGRNLVADNKFSSEWVGIELYDYAPRYSPRGCVLRARATEVFDNSFLRNVFYGTRTGIAMGADLFIPGTVIRNNLIQKNWFEGGEVGIRFAPNANFNYALPNSYSGVGTPVHDAGTGNVY